MQNLRLCAPALAALLSLGIGCNGDDDLDATLTVVNDSDFVIEELYLAPVGTASWGPNLIAGDPMFPGDEIVIGADCNFYDALLVDEEGVECELEAIDLCLNDATWFIYNDTCVAFEAARQAHQARQAAEAEAAQAPPPGDATPATPAAAPAP